MPKSGTTWLKALTFSIVNRTCYPFDQSPLLTSSPHALVPFPEFNTYLHHENPDLESIPCPRIFATHIPYKILPSSILNSGCRIIYICRDPIDMFVSLHHFLMENKVEDEVEQYSISMAEAFEMFCQGVHSFGPFWKHMLGFWDAHLKNSEKVLFLKYEDLKEHTLFCVKKIAEFIGFPFSVEEEKQGFIEQISKLCSFENLMSMEANKKGRIPGIQQNRTYFRKREVGDWVNHLTPSMAERIEMLMEMKLGASGLMINRHGKGSC